MSKVIVNIATFNSVDTIQRCVDSVLNQSLKEVVVYLSDDKSTDGTWELVNSLYYNSERVVLSRNKQNLGRIGNYRSMALANMHIPWRLNLDGDDFYSDLDFLRRAFEYIERLNVDIYMEGLEIYDSKLNLSYTRKIFTGSEDYRILSSEDYLKSMYRTVHSFVHSTMIYKTRLIKRDECFNKNSLNEDYMNMIRMLSVNTKICLVNRTPLVWVIHGLNESKKFSYYPWSPEMRAYRNHERSLRIRFSLKTSSQWYFNNVLYQLGIGFKSNIKSGKYVRALNILGFWLFVSFKHLVLRR